MKPRGLAIKVLIGVAGALFVLFFFLVSTVNQVPFDRLVAYGSSVVSAGPFKVVYSEIESSGSEVELENLRLLSHKDGSLLQKFDYLSIDFSLLPFLWGRGETDVFAQSGEGTLALSGGYAWGDVDIDLKTVDFDATILNGALAGFGISITAPMSLGLTLSFPYETPANVTGTIDIKAAPIQVLGGPVLAGFGLESLELLSLKGRREITAGKMDDLDLLIDGDQVWGHLRLSLSLRTPLSLSGYTVVPELKFSDEIEAKLKPVLPMTGLGLDKKGYYTRKLRGTFNRL